MSSHAPPFLHEKSGLYTSSEGEQGRDKQFHTFLDWGPVKDADEEAKGGLFSLNEVRENMIILRREV